MDSLLLWSLFTLTFKFTLLIHLHHPTCVDWKTYTHYNKATGIQHKHMQCILSESPTMHLYFGPVYSSIQSPGHRVCKRHTHMQSPLTQCSFVHVFSLQIARGMNLRLSDGQWKALSDQFHPLPSKSFKFATLFPISLFIACYLFMHFEWNVKLKSSSNPG